MRAGKRHAEANGGRTIVVLQLCRRRDRGEAVATVRSGIDLDAVERVRFRRDRDAEAAGGVGKARNRLGRIVREDIDPGARLRRSADRDRAQLACRWQRVERWCRRSLESVEPSRFPIGHIERAVVAQGDALRVSQIRDEVRQHRVRMHLRDGALRGIGLEHQRFRRHVDRAQRVEREARRLLEPGANPDLRRRECAPGQHEIAEQRSGAGGSRPEPAGGHHEAAVDARQSLRRTDPGRDLGDAVRLDVDADDDTALQSVGAVGPGEAVRGDVERAVVVRRDPAWSLQTTRHDRQRAIVFQPQDPSRLLLGDQQPSVVGKRQARWTVEMRDRRRHRGGAQTIDEAGAAVGDVHAAIGRDGDAHELVASIHDDVERRVGSDGLIGARRGRGEHERGQRRGRRARREAQAAARQR